MRPILLLLLFAVVGCNQTLNPCPTGQRKDPDQDRCVAVLTPETDAEVALLDAEAEDSAIVETDADTMDAGEAIADSGEDTAILGDGDAATLELDAALDAEPDAALDAAAPVCSTQDVQKWATGHLQPGLVELITNCYSTCANDATCADVCVHDQIGLEACSTCTSAQSVCSSTRCGAACTVSKNDKACLACLCEADCVGTFERCTAEQIGVCTPSLFGSDASPEQYTLSAPILLRQKTETGGLRASRLEVSGGQTWPTSSSYQFSTGFDKLLAFPLAGREYVLHTKSKCATEPCIARISPILTDGSFGHPVYDQIWTRGFDQLEMFMVGTTPYLLRYATGSAGEPAGTVWVDRIDLDTEQTALTLTPAARTVWLTSTNDAFAEVEPLQLAGSTYLLLRATGTTGEVRLLRVELSAPPALGFTPAAVGISWPDVDVVETLKVGGDWFVFTYDNAAGEAKQGTARLFGFVSDGDGQISLTAPLYEGSWAERATHAIGYATNGSALLITHDASNGKASQRALVQDSASWPDTFAAVLRTQSVGFNPPWNVVEIAGQGKW